MAAADKAGSCCWGLKPSYARHLPPPHGLLIFSLSFLFTLQQEQRVPLIHQLLCKIMPRALRFISFALFVLCALVGSVERKMFSSLHMIIGERSIKYYLLVLSSGRLTKK
jgi:hypothetical protein